MRKFTLQTIAFSILFLCAITGLHAQLGSNQWKYSNPKPFGFWCWQMSYADDNTALAVGEFGGIAKTNDGGGTWEYFAYTTTNSAGELLRPGFNDVQFVNSNLAYVVGDDGVMIKSTDGGINWTKLTTPFASVTNREYNKIHTVCFLDANTGYIGGDGDSATQQPTIYKTTNGGATWQPEFQFPAPSVSWLSASVLKIRFSASGIGYVTGASGLVWKYDNGVWSDYSITDSTIYPNVSQGPDTVLVQWGPEPTDTFTQISTYDDYTFGLHQQNYRAIAIVNDTAVVVGTQNNGGLIRINTSTATGSYLMLNNGSSGSSVYYPLNSPQIYNLICRDGNFIAGTSSGGQILISKDKGFTFSANDVYTPGTDEADNGFFGIDISPSGRVGLCGQGGVIADSLTQWRKPYILVRGTGGLSEVQFVDANYGIAAGNAGAMLRTNNGGNTWEDVSNPTFAPWDYYTGLVYLSPQVLIASANNAQLYKSVDRGSSFDLLYAQPEAASIDAIDFINEDTGWITANVRYPDNVNFVDTTHQFIYHTTDGGNTWDTSTTVFPYSTSYSTKNQLNVIKFLNGNLGYAGGDNGELYKTTDGGITWVKQVLPAYAENKPIKSVAIVDENIVYVSGNKAFFLDNQGNFVVEGAVVMKTVNGGASWAMCNAWLQPKDNYPKILMYNASEGLLFGSGVVYSTVNGGDSWTPYYTTTGNFAGDFEGASFAPIPGCTNGICSKVFAVAGKDIFKLDADVVLPVKFSKLTGSGTPQGNQLFWTAFTQENVSWFEVERSDDGVSFSKLAEKIYPGTAGYQSYQWLDKNVTGGRNYYRIKAVERTGAVYYTNIVVIASKKAAQWAYQLSNGNLILNNPKAEKGNVAATLVNAAGQVVASKSWNHSGGAFNQPMQLPVNAKGIYVVKVENAGTVATFKIFIQ